MVEGDPRASEPSTAAEVSGETVEHALRSAFDLYGPDMLYAAERLRIFLTDRCPGAESDIALVMAGLDEQVPQALLSAHTADELRSLLPRLQARLTDQRSLNRYASAWSVTTWADALRLRPEAAAEASAAANDDAANRIARHAVIPAASFTAVGAAIPSGDTTLVAPAAASAATGATSAGLPQSAVLVGAATPAAAEAVASSQATADPLWAVGPTAGSPGPAPWYSDDAEATDGARDSEPLATARSISVWYGIGAAIVAIAVIVFAIRYQANRSASEAVVTAAAPSSAQDPATASRADAPIAATAATAAPTTSSMPAASASSQDASTAAPSTTATAPATNPSAAAAPALAAPQIADVVSGEPLVGDGKQRPLYLTLATPHDGIRSVTSRFVAGDERLRSAPATIDTTGKLLPDGRLPVGTIGLRTTRPAQATFEFVATTDDGRNSAPFEKELTIAAAPAGPPVITRVAARDAIVAGQPFWLTIAFEEGSGKLASIDRSIVSDREHGPYTSPKVTSVPVSSLEKTDDGALILPIHSARAAAGTTMEVTLVDASGRRSAPQQIVFDVAPARPAEPERNASTTTPVDRPGTSSTAARATSGEASGTGVASGAIKTEAKTTRGAAVPCTRTTCGNVVSVREIESPTARLQSASPADRARRSYEILVRTDDRVIHTFRQSTPLKTGAAVQLKNGQLVGPSAPRQSPAARREPKLLPESVPVFTQ